MDEPTVTQKKDEGREVQEEGRDHWEQRARAFSRARMKLFGLRSAVGLLFPFLFWYLGGAAWLEGASASVVPQAWLTAPLFLLAYQLLVSLLFLPLSWYGGFVLQHRFGLSRQRLSGWVEDWVKSTLLGTLFFVAGLEAFYLVVAAFPEAWWWVLAAMLSLVILLLTFVAPVLLLPIFYKCSPLEDRELAERIERLAERVGARVSRVCAIDLSRRTVAANAALTGIGRTRRVLLGDTMLRQFTPDEVETVVAHELGHHVHGDIWRGLLLELFGLWVGLFLLQWAVRPAFLQLGLGDISLPANLPLLIFLGEIASLLLMPVANTFSRHRETQADIFAARVSRRPDAYASALYRLAKQNLAELWPPRWVELLFYTHPAIGRRIERVVGPGAR